MMFRFQWIMAGLGLVLVRSGHGGVIEFHDKNDWMAAVGRFATADFVGFEAGTVITEQYADLGVHFTDGNDTVVCCSDTTYPEDGAGLDGNGDITLLFDTPQAYVGVDYPGFLRIELFSDGQSIYLSSLFFGDPVGNFAGLFSTQLFDMAVLMDDPSWHEAEIDNVHFGIPAPASLALFGLAALAPRRRRLGPAS